MEDNVQDKLRFVRMAGHAIWFNKHVEHIHETDE
jgi:hypothetical protein